MSKTHIVSPSCGRTEERGEQFIAQQIGDYQIQRLVGRGGMGLVFEGTHRRLGHRAAIKIVHDRLSHSELVAARFLREARAASMVDHPGIVRVFDVGRTALGLSFLVMEYLDGVLLSTQLTKEFSRPYPRAQRAGGPGNGPPPHASFALRIASQISEALGAVHAKNIIHRDLKPDNIFLVRDEEVPGGQRAKIFDFGIAKLFSNSKLPGVVGPAAEGDLTGPRTVVGTVLGTPLYMSPEQWRGESRISDRVDVYAAGCIFYELFTGHPPFSSRTIAELMDEHLREMPNPLRAEAPWVPGPVEVLISRMLSKSPADRPSMKEVAAALATYQQGPVHEPHAILLPWPAAKQVEAGSPPFPLLTLPTVRYASNLSTAETQVIEPRTLHAHLTTMILEPRRRLHLSLTSSPIVAVSAYVFVLLATAMAAYLLIPPVPHLK